MDFLQKKRQLQDIIKDKLAGLINHDYVLLDLPYHANIGDSIIALGEKNFLKEIDCKCLYAGSHCAHNFIIDKNTVILFHGGGNFGDLWRDCADLRNSIISRYPNNKFIVFPQSVCYENEKNLQEDIEVYSRCSNMTICARDRVSFEFLKRHFVQNNILLVPDMAFYLDPKFLKRSHNTGKTLFLLRNDKELVQNPMYNIVPSDANVADWPTMNYNIGAYIPYNRIWKRIENRIRKYFGDKSELMMENLYWQKILLPYNVKCGVDFLNCYDSIYTTRLHAAVLGYLLGKQIHIFDNKDGKISALYETWLKDCEGIDIIK